MASRSETWRFLYLFYFSSEHTHTHTHTLAHTLTHSLTQSHRQTDRQTDRHAVSFVTQSVHNRFPIFHCVHHPCPFQWLNWQYCRLLITALNYYYKTCRLLNRLNPLNSSSSKTKDSIQFWVVAGFDQVKWRDIYVCSVMIESIEFAVFCFQPFKKKSIICLKHSVVKKEAIIFDRSWVKSTESGSNCCDLTCFEFGWHLHQCGPIVSYSITVSTAVIQIDQTRIMTRAPISMPHPFLLPQFVHTFSSLSKLKSF